MGWNLDFSRGDMRDSREREEENDNSQLFYVFFIKGMAKQLLLSHNVVFPSKITAFCLGRQHCDSVTSVFKTHCQKDSIQPLK